MTVFNKFSMRWKLVLASVLIEVVMLTALVWNGVRLLEERLTEQTDVRLSEVSILLNSALGPLMAGQDYAPIADLFQESRRRDGIQYFLLTDRSGRVLLADGWPKESPPPATRTPLEIHSDQPRLDTRMAVVLSGQTYGYLNFGISTQFLIEARQHLLRQSLIIGASAVLISALLLALLGAWLTRHLRSLQRASEEVSAGHFHTTLPVQGSDEVAHLATAFNRMTSEVDQKLSALRESEARFRALLSLTTDVYWSQDREFRFTSHHIGRPDSGIKETSERLLGRCRWEMETTLSPDEWAAHKAALEAHETFYSLEYGIVETNGKIHYFTVSGEPVFDENGNFAGYRGTASDISARKEAENSLRLAANVFAEAHEGIIVTDHNWRVIDINPMVVELTGFEREEWLERNLQEHFSGSNAPEFVPAIIASLHETGHWRGEASGLRKGESDFPKLMTASAVRDNGEKVSNYIFIFSDITAIKEQQQRLEHLAHFDALTRLPNRVLLADRLQLAISQARRNEDLLAIAYLDLDGFKPVNDTYGHDAGDMLLVEVASRLRNCVRGGDTVARLGGDEFVLLVRIDDFGECEAALLRVLQALSDDFNIKHHPVNISASIGVTLFPHDGADPDVLLRHADQAMYVAKQAGRNRYHLFDPEHDRQIRTQRQQFSRIQSALLAGEFELHYQPKVDMRRGTVVGAEALIRWRHPEQGIVPPAEFLPAIEGSDFSITLGEWVIETALAQMDVWRSQGILLPISVNVSATQLQAANFVERLGELLSMYRSVPPAWLEIEIVETAALEDMQSACDTINRCKNLGLSFALDDFGTGYSSLTYFKRLPVYLLKIDQSFIRDMLSDPEDLAIVEGVISLAHAFHREVIAEGVETIDHGKRLLQLGCHLAQGYGIARPMPADQIPGWIRDYRAPAQWKI